MSAPANKLPDFPILPQDGEAFASKVRPQEHQGCPDVLPEAIVQQEVQRHLLKLETKLHVGLQVMRIPIKYIFITYQLSE